MSWLDGFLGGGAPRVVLNGRRFSPDKFGEVSVSMAVDQSAEAVRTLIALGKDRTDDDSIYTRMAANPAVAQLPLISLLVAIYFYALLNSPGATAEHMKAVRAGSARAFAATRLGPEGAGVLGGFAEHFASLLWEEGQQRETGGLEESLTGAAVRDALAESLSGMQAYRAAPPLDLDPMDRMLVAHAIAAITTGHLRACLELGLKWET